MMTREAEKTKLVSRCRSFMKGTKRMYDGERSSGLKGDMWFFELFHHLNDCAEEIERLRTENWQLRQACGYPIPADKETINNPFKCGMCDARNRDLSPHQDGGAA